MKKKVLWMLALLVAGVATVKAQTAQIALQHKGNITMFGSTQTQDALDQAEDGDTLFFNEGSFKADIYIRKKVSLIGSGENTILPGDVHVAIPDSATLSQYLLDALYITGTVYVDSAVSGLRMRKCQLYAMTFNAEIDNSFVERCYIKQNVNQNNNLVGVSFYNSKVKYVRWHAKNTSSAVYTNCNVYDIGAQQGDYISNGNYYQWLYRSSYHNCILYSFTKGSGAFSNTFNATFNNCLSQNTAYTAGVDQNCYTFTKGDDAADLLDANIECSLPTDSLKEKGYLGTDGTVVGIYGGNLPYTLTPSMPRVTEHNIIVDPEKKTLNVTLKVTAN